MKTVLIKIPRSLALKFIDFSFTGVDATDEEEDVFYAALKDALAGRTVKGDE